MLEALKHIGTHIDIRMGMDWRVRHTVDLMRHDLHRPWTVAELSRRVNLSPSRLAHLFARDVGVAPGQYLRDLRLERARALVEHSTLSVKEIMARVGFNDPSHFARDFKRRYGAPPRTVRARARSPGRVSRFRQETVGFANTVGALTRDRLRILVG